MGLHSGRRVSAVGLGGKGGGDAAVFMDPGGTSPGARCRRLLRRDLWDFVHDTSFFKVDRLTPGGRPTLKFHNGLRMWEVYNLGVGR